MLKQFIEQDSVHVYYNFLLERSKCHIFVHLRVFQFGHEEFVYQWFFTICHGFISPIWSSLRLKFVLSLTDSVVLNLALKCWVDIWQSSHLPLNIYEYIFIPFKSYKKHRAVPFKCVTRVHSMFALFDLLLTVSFVFVVQPLSLL